MLEINHFDIDFVFMLLEQVLCIVRAIEIFTSRVFTRASMIATNNKVCAAVVGADQAVPDSLAWATHAHCKV